MAPRVKGYPLEPYLQYWQVHYRLDERNPEDILGFLHRNEGTLLAEQLRSDWLKLQARRGDWQLPATGAPRLVTRTPTWSLLWAVARSRRGRIDAREAEAPPGLCLVPRDLPEGC